MRKRRSFRPRLRWLETAAGPAWWPPLRSGGERADSGDPPARGCGVGSRRGSRSARAHEAAADRGDREETSLRPGGRAAAWEPVGRLGLRAGAAAGRPWVLSWGRCAGRAVTVMRVERVSDAGEGDSGSRCSWSPWVRVFTPRRCLAAGSLK